MWDYDSNFFKYIEFWILEWNCNRYILDDVLKMYFVLEFWSCSKMSAKFSNFTRKSILKMLNKNMSMIYHIAVCCTFEEYFFFIMILKNILISHFNLPIIYSKYVEKYYGIFFLLFEAFLSRYTGSRVFKFSYII